MSTSSSTIKISHLVNPGVEPVSHAWLRLRLLITLLLPTFGNPEKKNLRDAENQKGRTYQRFLR